MDDLVAQGCWNGKGSLIDHGPGGRRGECGHVADVAANRIKQLGADLRVRRGCLRSIARDDLGSTHEAGKVIDILQTLGVKRVFRIGHRVAYAGYVGRRETTGYTL